VNVAVTPLPPPPLGGLDRDTFNFYSQKVISDFLRKAMLKMESPMLIRSIMNCTVASHCVIVHKTAVFTSVTVSAFNVGR
jgi:hypothetical protein